MGCLCLPNKQRHCSANDRRIFHWPNFTFSHSQHSINPRRIHSTFSLTNRPRPGFIASHRHPLHSDRPVAPLPKAYKSKASLKTTKTAPAVTVNPPMSDQYAPPSGPPPYRSANQHHVQFAGGSAGNSELASNNPFRSAHMSTSQGQHPSSADAPPTYEPPTAPPPPSWHGEKKQAFGGEDYAPPPGPPPSHGSKGEDYAPPPGPPPSHAASEPEPPPYDPWMAIPDNALLPPPPALKDEKSPTANATFDDAARAHRWCRRNPLWPPQQHSQQALQRIANAHIALTSPPNTKHVQLSQTPTGARVRTTPKCTDTVFLSDLPLYTASTHSPQTIYFELHVLSMGSQNPSPASMGEADAGIAIGFLAPPYPSWRLPGWERASIGVHGDDGRRYSDDSYGGQVFTEPFGREEVVGIGMTMAMPQRVFFTRNGREEGGWGLREERDREDKGGDVEGLEGGRDVLAAVGCFGGVEFEVRFRREEWVFRP